MPDKPDMSGFEADGVLPLVEGAIQLHETYTLLTGAGFEEYQALFLVGVLLKGVPMPDWVIARISGQ